MKQYIILAGGKQYFVDLGDVIDVDIEKNVSSGDELSFDILCQKNDDVLEVGAPLIEGIKAVCSVVELIAGPKGIAFKYKRRKGYKRKVGFRQKYVRVKLEKIE
ncbi:MAG: 50S ribosomal protein L21, partial [Chlamydiia bacterium]|nr:50S ribosomal protein L21 [Chlamydiia bacterium]